jgi:transposase InsO family protein
MTAFASSHVYLQMSMNSSWTVLCKKQHCCIGPATIRALNAGTKTIEHGMVIAEEGVTLIDEYSHHCLAVVVDRSIKSDDVLHSLSNLFLIYGIPENIRSDNGPEFTATAIRRWLERIGVKTAFIQPGSPWENGYNKSFNGKLYEA